MKMRFFARFVSAAMLLTVGVPCALALPDAAPSLVITPETTVILDRTTYAGRFLQYYLLKCVAGAPDAEKYRLDAKPRLDRAASASFPLARKLEELPDASVVIAVGKTEYLTDDDLAAIESKAGTVLIRRRGNVIVVAASQAGGPWKGEMAAMRVFLDKVVGVRMYAPGGADGLEWISIPAERELTVDGLDMVIRPYLAKATFSSGGHKRNQEWLRMNTVVSEGLDLRARHTIIGYFPPEKYYADYPQLYPMHKNGVRPKPIGDAWNPCFADPDLAARIAMQEVRESQKTNKRGYLSFGVMDCHYDCHCPVCRKSLTAHDGNAANLWYAVLNRVARQCREQFPGLYLTNYAYSNVGIPVGMRIEPNIVVDNVIKSYRYTDANYWPGQERETMAFAELGASWVTHDWNFQGVTPRIYTRQLASFLQWGVQHGMLGIYTEWSGQEYWYLTGAHYWVLRQLLSDPYQDPDALWRQYCRDMFGAAWEQMYRFYDLFQQKQVVADRYFQRGDWPRQDSIGYTAGDLVLQRGWLESAMTMTRDDAMIQKRLGAVMRYFRAHELLAQATGVPGRLHHTFSVVEERTGINRAALAFYVNDDGSKLLEFERYYEDERTLAPDSNAEDRNSGIRFSYRNNYARALGTIIQAVKTEAMAGVDLASADLKTVKAVVKKARSIYRANLPAKHKRARAKEVQALMEKILWIPRVGTLPTFDGDLSDDVWKRAARLTGWTQADLLLPTTDGNETDGRIMRVGDRLVIGLVCQQPKGIWAETPAAVHTGTRIWREAGCEIFFGPPVRPGEDQEFIQYVVNSLGAFRGFRKAQDNRKDVHCAVKQAADGMSYTIEVALPLKVDGLYDYSTGCTFTFNVMRNPFYADTFNPKERIGWAPIFFTAGRPESRGLVVLE
ncbi:MAG: DUF4838 domain-containing protein [Lentisphaerae bacterium]|jgi:hypothetical protein|nr:DUF4838 domain-containing protein [Lentisphaerota bacterium]MBT5611884.1 DUF4838 domain-containing protein [Lentisphaerota bacterium]MBT7054951.1 DUF4838 domain-containing protein [Lentisphaerota bacterium]MBT7845907.1 DUF4838 domain-containing protein [Lentisphaerota bacterium]